MTATVFPRCTLRSYPKISPGNNRLNQSNGLLLQAILRSDMLGSISQMYFVCMQNTLRKFQLTATTENPIKAGLQKQSTFYLNPFRNFLFRSHRHTALMRATVPGLISSLKLPSPKSTQTLRQGLGCPSFLDGLEPGAGQLTSLSLWCK